MDTAKVIMQRNFLPYSIYIESAKHFCDELDKKDYISWYDLMASITLSALSIEALANTVGELTIEKFEDFESLQPLSKVRLICNNANIEYKKGNNPYNDIISLIKVRNKLAHPKYKLLKYESKEMPIAEAQSHYHEVSEPLHDIEKNLNPEFAKRSIKAVLELQSIFEKLLPPEVIHEVSKKELKFEANKTLETNSLP